MLSDILTTFIILSIVVLIHELGHFVAAKLVGVRVDEFGFGYPPKALAKKVGETIYSLNWLPFGGFVRLFGEQEAEAEGSKDPRAFFNKNKRQRIFVILAGVFMNMVLAIVTFSLIYSINGIPEKVNYLIVDRVAPGSVAAMVGFKQNDKLLAVNKQPVQEPEAFKALEESVASSQVTFDVDRKGELKTLTASEWDNNIVIDDIEKDSPADAAGLKKGDIIVALNGMPVSNVAKFIEQVKTTSDQSVTLSVIGNGQTRDVVVEPRKNPSQGQGAMGVMIGNELAVSNIDNIFYPVWQMPLRGIKIGLEEAFVWTRMMYQGLWDMIRGVFSGNVPEVRGIIGITEITATVAKEGILPLIKFMGILSINLAVINILPFPALDGGRTAFILLESVIGRRIKPKIEAAINMAGMAVLLALMALITVADVLRLIRGNG